MNEFLTEQLVKQRQTSTTLLKKAGLIAVTLFTLPLTVLLQQPLLIWVTIILIAVDVFLFKRMNLEFEYVYFNGDLDIDKIMDMQSRKRVFSVNMKDVELVAPVGDSQLHAFERMKAFDYSTNNPQDKTYVMIASFKGQTVKVLFNPNEKILKGMQYLAPRKVVF